MFNLVKIMFVSLVFMSAAQSSPVREDFVNEEGWNRYQGRKKAYDQFREFTFLNREDLVRILSRTNSLEPGAAEYWYERYKKTHEVGMTWEKACDDSQLRCDEHLALLKEYEEENEELRKNNSHIVAEANKYMHENHLVKVNFNKLADDYKKLVLDSAYYKEKFYNNLLQLEETENKDTQTSPSGDYCETEHQEWMKNFQTRLDKLLEKNIY